MEINNLNINSSTHKAKQTDGAASGKSKVSTEQSNAASGETVFISSESKALKDLEASIKAEPDFDVEKVERIKAAISEGNFAIDDEALANNIIEFDDLLG
ncbi:flagellar biosynthesis anti-sigma factor FlgM [Litoribrevibacter euphylliae]|uniref:Negative regulator of flagellin synthesis n=1 Tax=Litoribrevibacter euphylliae TaxID=1834034 RepID=A0ABV7HD14_9GAMM